MAGKEAQGGILRQKRFLRARTKTCSTNKAGMINRFALAFVLLAGLSLPAAGAIRVVFRMDDYCNGVPVETMEDVFSTFRSVSGSLTVGVVPAVATDGNLNSTGTAHSILAKVHGDLLARWSKEGVVELGVHGLEHRNIALPAEPLRSEFAGARQEKQLELIGSACRLVEERTGRRSSVFIPPWNTFDFFTLQAAVANGIEIVSAIPRLPHERDACTDRLTFLPVSVRGFSSWSNDLSDARSSGDADPVLVVLFHVDDFRPRLPNPLTAERVREVLVELGRMPDVRIVSMAAVRASEQNPTIGDYMRLEEWKVRWRAQRRWVPRFLRVDVDRRFPVNVGFSPGHLDATVRRYVSGVALFYAVAVVVLAAVAMLAVKVARRVGGTRLSG